MENVEKKESSVKASIAVFVIAWLVYASAYFARTGYSIAVSSMREEGIITASLAGTISAVYFIVYASGQILNGILADKVHPLPLVIIGTSLIAFSNFAMANLFTPSWLCLLWWAIHGFGQAMLWSPIYYTISNVLSPKIRFIAITFIGFMSPIGKGSSYLINGATLKNGWSGVFMNSGFVFVCLVVLWTLVWVIFGKKLFIPSKESKMQKTSDVATAEKPSFIKIVITSGLIFIIPVLIIHGLFMNGAVEWIPTILKDQFHLSPSASSILTTLLPICSFPYVFICNYIYKKSKNDDIKGSFLSFVFSLIPMIIIVLLCIKPGSVFGYTAEAVIFIVMYAILYIFQCSFNHIITSLLPTRFVHCGLSATVSGISDAFIYLGSAIATYGIAGLMDSIPIVYMMLIWLALLVIASLIALLPRKKWGKFYKQHDIFSRAETGNYVNVEKTETDGTATDSQVE